MKPEEIEAISSVVDIRQYWGNLSEEQLYKILNTYHKWILGLIDHIETQNRQPTWQVTEERREALEQAAHICREVTAFDTAKVLRAMLEANQ